MSRLKFAWARGARIQEYQNRHIVGIRVMPWWGTDSMPDWNTISALRIHPDDEHLAYGPISSSLRDRAIYLDIPSGDAYDRAAYSMWLRFQDGHGFQSALINDYYMTMLFFAEFLADEGL